MGQRRLRRPKKCWPNVGMPMSDRQMCLCWANVGPMFYQHWPNSGSMLDYAASQSWANVASAGQNNVGPIMAYQHRTDRCAYVGPASTMIISVLPMLAQRRANAGLWPQANVGPTLPPPAKRTLAQCWHTNVGPTDVLTLGQHWPNQDHKCSTNVGPTTGQRWTMATSQCWADIASAGQKNVGPTLAANVGPTDVLTLGQCWANVGMLSGYEQF